MSTYVRVKRLKQTLFLHCEPSDHPVALKEKITQINNVPVENQRLLLGKQTLEDGLPLSEQSVENDTVIFLVYRLDGEDDKWEEVNICQPQRRADGDTAGSTPVESAGS
eukprot:TRINITY_DN1438_c0_g1_i1.p2 TRINITY_DN1438_c0_g1~~TRINITY_DN1438_c0_g1_i1.p2  ORF type:complete len:109 (-),score=35.91 TRINITY_DN1438_c0_g1_i1:73-399(-)